MPEFIEPSLATLVDAPPAGDRLIHEIKFDGYRLQIHKQHERLKFYTRRGHDWAERFKALCGPPEGSTPIFW